jgi:hypothetical protein
VAAADALLHGRLLHAPPLSPDPIYQQVSNINRGLGILLGVVHAVLLLDTDDVTTPVLRTGAV